MGGREGWVAVNSDPEFTRDVFTLSELTDYISPIT